MLYFQQIIPLLAIGILFTGCTGMQGANMHDQQNVNVEKQLEKRQYLQQFEEEPEKLPERNPQENEAIGDRYLQSGDINKAFLYYAKAMQVEPDNSGLQYKVGMLLLKRDMYTEAEHSFLKILSMEYGQCSCP